MPQVQSNASALPLHVVRYPQIDSTSLEAKRIIRSGSSVPDVVAADMQTTGRGCGDKKWSSPPGNLYFSSILKTQNRYSKLSIIAAVALGDAIQAVSPSIPIAYKFPNDVYINEKKVAGILIEQEGEYWIVGCGVNVASSPEFLSYPTTYLHLLDASISKDRLLVMIAENLVEYQSIDFEIIRQKWMKNCQHMNQFITLRNGKSGVFKGINQDAEEILSFSIMGNM